jgi:hypothetical protein
VTVEQKTIAGQLGDQEVRIVVQAATVLSGMRRAILADRVSTELDARGLGSSSLDVAVLLVARFTYPDLLAAVVESEGINTDDMSLDDFLNLPQALVDAWLVAVYELCPHWSPRSLHSEAEAAAEKKKEAKGSAASG